MSNHVPYNPLEKVNLGISVAEAMLSQPVHPLGDIPLFSGAGIYAIYYRGAHPAYGKLAAINASQGPTSPIYVGKAIPEGGRKGGGGVTRLKAGASKALFKRLGEHAESIRATQLSIEDFSCRYLVVDDIWIPLGESLLIAKFSPVWNLLVDGFGNHDPGNGRYNGLVPKWDVLHPGRAWAPKCKSRAETSNQISTEVMAWLEQAPSLMQSRYFVREAEAEYRISRTDSSDLP